MDSTALYILKECKYRVEPVKKHETHVNAETNKAGKLLVGAFGARAAAPVAFAA